MEAFILTARTNKKYQVKNQVLGRIWCHFIILLSFISISSSTLAADKGMLLSGKSTDRALKIIPTKHVGKRFTQSDIGREQGRILIVYYS